MNKIFSIIILLALSLSIVGCSVASTMAHSKNTAKKSTKLK